MALSKFKGEVMGVYGELGQESRLIFGVGTLRCEIAPPGRFAYDTGTERDTLRCWTWVAFWSTGLRAARLVLGVWFPARYWVSHFAGEEDVSTGVVLFLLVQSSDEVSSISSSTSSGHIVTKFWLESVALLGHIVSSDGIRVDTQKIEALQNCSRPTSPTDIRSFLGLAGYYRRELESEVDDWVYLKVAPMKGVMKFGKKGKLSPRYIDRYCISKRMGNVAYEYHLPQEEFMFLHWIWRGHRFSANGGGGGGRGGSGGAGGGSDGGSGFGIGDGEGHASSETAAVVVKMVLVVLALEVRKGMGSDCSRWDSQVIGIGEVE
ncbi:hypothetical protein MTR67_052254 [Solanum verrucosum]|uniref:Tf2-1-like SH3-like domain-containing protein n=1 Tax=Solanum verrucosum TaxID=315347 RepID=A0AAF0V7N5_SOLVR|nr:hypothetical protein MTR67_052254 [Solanum verrucosum]